MWRKGERRRGGGGKSQIKKIKKQKKFFFICKFKTKGKVLPINRPTYKAEPFVNKAFLENFVSSLFLNDNLFRFLSKNKNKEKPFFFFFKEHT